MPTISNTDWKPQFGDPILPPQPKKKRTTKKRVGSWKKPSKTMLESERAKCKITRIDPVTRNVLAVIEPRSRAKVKRYGQSGKKRYVPTTE